MSQKTEYHAPKIGAIVRLIISFIKQNPSLVDDFEMLKANLFNAMPELKDRSKCANCEASMKEYVYTFDAWDAILLMKMAEAVQEKRRKGSAFTDANKVRIPDLPTSHAVRCRTTQCAKLGLIAQMRSQGNKRVAGVWVITKRGWEALAGKPVPKRVKVWRKRIEERYDDTITISQALDSHIEYLENRAKRGKVAKEDHRAYIRAYNPQDWYEFSYHEGALL